MKNSARLQTRVWAFLFLMSTLSIAACSDEDTGNQIPAKVEAAAPPVATPNLDGKYILSSVACSSGDFSEGFPAAFAQSLNDLASNGRVTFNIQGDKSVFATKLSENCSEAQTRILSGITGYIFTSTHGSTRCLGSCDPNECAPLESDGRIDVVDYHFEGKKLITIVPPKSKTCTASDGQMVFTYVKQP